MYGPDAPPRTPLVASSSLRGRGPRGQAARGGSRSASDISANVLLQGLDPLRLLAGAVLALGHGAQFPREAQQVAVRGVQLPAKCVCVRCVVLQLQRKLLPLQALLTQLPHKPLHRIVAHGQRRPQRPGAAVRGSNGCQVAGVAEQLNLQIFADPRGRDLRLPHYAVDRLRPLGLVIDKLGGQTFQVVLHSVDPARQLRHSLVVAHDTLHRALQSLGQAHEFNQSIVHRRRCRGGGLQPAVHNLLQAGEALLPLLRQAGQLLALPAPLPVQHVAELVQLLVGVAVRGEPAGFRPPIHAMVDPEGSGLVQEHHGLCHRLPHGLQVRVEVRGVHAGQATSLRVLARATRP
mmetsp:Transcript_85931/g.221210  ORF Transcript_85931/g.221210 Transcript_85931/m.221210 type:complete len:348 (-) Transcript_85931:461-1504(-)